MEVGKISLTDRFEHGGTRDNRQWSESIQRNHPRLNQRNMGKSDQEQGDPLDLNGSRTAKREWPGTPPAVMDRVAEQQNRGGAPSRYEPKVKVRALVTAHKSHCTRGEPRRTVANRVSHGGRTNHEVNGCGGGEQMGFRSGEGEMR